MNLDRNLYQVDQSGTDSVSQTLTPRVVTEISNPNQPEYSRTINFPQPSIVGMGYVTSGGAPDLTYFFLPSQWSVSASGSTYTITHNIGNKKKYLPVILPNSTSFGAGSFIPAVTNNDNTTVIVMESVAGFPSTAAFSFIFYLIP